MQIKVTIYTATHLLEWLKLKRLTIPELAKMRSKWISHTFASETENWYSHFTKQLGNFL